MSAYLMVGLNIRDADGYQAYVQKALPTLSAPGVEVLAISDDPVAIEGTSPYRRYVLLKFPDHASLEAWYRSPEYQAAVPIRHATSETGFMVSVPGLG